jgi:hypothetical protein
MLNKVARHLAAGDLRQKNAPLKSFEERPDILASKRFLPQ